MATIQNEPAMGKPEEVRKADFSLAEILKSVESLHRYRQGYGLYSHKENRFLSEQQIDSVMNVPMAENNYAPIEPAAETLMLLLNDLIYFDNKTIHFFVPLLKRIYGTSMSSNTDTIDKLILRFQHFGFVYKREQRAGKTMYERPIASVRISCGCVTSTGAKFVFSRFLHRSTDPKGLSLPQLEETAAYGIVAANFLMVAFARKSIPLDSLDPYYQGVEIHFPKFKYIRDFADEYGNASLSPGRIVFPGRENPETGLKSRKKVCIFTSQFIYYNSAVLPAEDFERYRKHTLELARWSAAREKERASAADESVETAVFVAIEDMNTAKQIKEELITLLEDMAVDRIFLTSEAAVEEICLQRRQEIPAALMELRADASGEYRYRSPESAFFR